MTDLAYPAPRLLVACLTEIHDELGRVAWNIHQFETASPFVNSGARFECSTFAAHSYSWTDEAQPWNLRWSDLRVRWYKHWRRDTTTNIAVDGVMAAQMLDECIDALRRIDAGKEEGGWL